MEGKGSGGQSTANIGVSARPVDTPGPLFSKTRAWYVRVTRESFARTREVSRERAKNAADRKLCCGLMDPFFGQQRVREEKKEREKLAQKVLADLSNRTIFG